MGEYYGVRRTDDDDRLEHIGLPKGWKKPNAKYIARLVTSYGYRYIYNPAQLAAAKAGKAVGNAANQVGRAAGQAGRAIDRTVGFSARRKAQATANAAEKFTHPSKKGDYRDQPNPRYGRIARDKARKAKSAYDNTLLGRAENAFNSGRKAVNKAANDAGRFANQTYKNARSAANKAIGDAGKAASRAIDDAGRFANKTGKNITRAANQAGRAIDRTVGFSARRKAQATANAAEKFTHPSKKGDYRDQPNPRMGRLARDKAKRARSAYDRTLLGRAENAFNSGMKAVNKAASQVGKAATDTYNAARKGVNDAGSYVNKQVKKGQNAVKDYQRFRSLSDAERAIAVSADKAGLKKVKNPLTGKSYSVRGASTANKIYNMEKAIRNAPGNARRGVQNAWDTVSGSVNNAYKDVRNFVNPPKKKKKKKGSKKPTSKYLKKETSASFYKNS